MADAGGDIHERSPSIYTEYSLELGDYVRSSIINSAGSWANAAVASALVAMGLFLIVRNDQIGWVSVIFGLLIITGGMTIPIIWWAARRRKDLLLSQRQLTVDGSGVRIVTPNTNVEQSWSTFRTVREQSDGFVLDYGTGVSMLIPKHAFAEGDLDTFRMLADEAGKLDTSPRWRSTVFGILLGAGMVIVGLVAIANTA
jgi:hypothetical protein